MYVVLKSGLYVTPIGKETMTAPQTSLVAICSNQQRAEEIAAQDPKLPCWVEPTKVWVDKAVLDQEPFWG